MAPGRTQTPDQESQTWLCNCKSSTVGPIDGWSETIHDLQSLKSLAIKCQCTDHEAQMHTNVNG